MRFSFVLAGVLAASVLATCTRKSDTHAAPANAPPTFDDAATSAAIHAALLTPGSDVLYAAESLPPATAEGWASVEAGAEKVVEGARLMERGARPAGRSEWVRIAKAIEDNAQKSAAAARARNAEAVAAADGDFTAQCEDCHNAFRDHGGGMMKKP